MNIQALQTQVLFPDIGPANPPSSPNGGPVSARNDLNARFRERIFVNTALSRKLVSYQGNKRVAGLRWMKYKEGFSAELVASLLDQAEGSSVLDPFSGIGTTALTASARRIAATGIEIMPVGNLAAKAISCAANGMAEQEFAAAASGLLRRISRGNGGEEFPHIRITEGAFPAGTETALGRARSYVNQLDNYSLKTMLELACASVLEEVSYTRKDGQYLRWDPRSGRTASTRLNKGDIPSLETALTRRIQQIITDLPLVAHRFQGRPAQFIDGSSLDELRKQPPAAFDTVITSPPYANRYDYTRTYALELAYLGYTNEDVKKLRQELLSATVENHSKRKKLEKSYGDSSLPERAFKLVDEQDALNEALTILREHARELGNRHVIRLIENYFSEMAVIVCELKRLIKPGGHVFMVNDNVRYHGEEIPVDLILSDFAEQSGFQCKVIWTLKRGKGNSSQQMGRFGRQEIRKCVYHWVRTHD